MPTAKANSSTPSVTISGKCFYQTCLNVLRHTPALNNCNTKNRRGCPTKNKQVWLKICIYGHTEHPSDFFSTTPPPPLLK